MAQRVTHADAFVKSIYVDAKNVRMLYYLQHHNTPIIPDNFF